MKYFLCFLLSCLISTSALAGNIGVSINPNGNPSILWEGEAPCPNFPAKGHAFPRFSTTPCVLENRKYLFKFNVSGDFCQVNLQDLREGDSICCSKHAYCKVTTNSSFDSALIQIKFFN